MIPSARGESVAFHFLQIHHGDEFVRNQLGCHNTTYLQRFACRYAHDPRHRIEDIAEDPLEGDAIAKPAGNGGEQGVQRGDQGNKANQHGVSR